ncbi:ACP S-malonyltransferase [Saprospiraceae bacterium]|nr:ACP S-malonyltransferase [Saprospiraceae bacterium]
MIAFVFPGQASQFPGMGKDLYDEYPQAKELFDKANEILGFDIADIMFNGTADDLKQTSVTQPAVFLHSVIKSIVAGDDFKPDVVAGHSLGEFSALVAAGAMEFEDGLKLVSERAQAMQKACDEAESTMAAILGLENDVVEQVCADIDEVVIPANYNCPGQLVISGSIEGINKACEQLTEKGARRAIVLPVNGAFHSPFMESARVRLEAAIEATNFKEPKCPIYQNVDAKPQTDPSVIKNNLVNQLTSPVRWTQTMLNMIEDGVESFVEVGGNGKTLSGFVRKVDRKFPTSAL